MRKRILSMVFAVMLIVTILPTTALAVEDNTFSDIADHWAEDIILEKQAKGLVKGMSDGTFKPDDSLTNAQLITLVNRFFGLTMSEDNQFADVEGDEWYAGEADNAEYYGYVDSATLSGDTPILRLDMLRILDSLMHVEETNVAAPFDDLDGLSSEELDLVNRFYARGYLEGDGQGNATLGEGLTRAQVLTFFGNTLGYIVLTQDDVANIPENGKVTVIGKNIVIEDKTIEELFISPGVYGEVTVRNTVLTKATLGGEGTDGAVIFDNVTVSGELIVQDGDVDLTGTNIKKVTIRGESKINTDKDTAIRNLNVNAPVTITGGGKITEAEITVDGAAIEKKPTYYVVKNGVTADISGDKITYANDRPRSSGGTAAPISPAQVTQVKLVDGTWVADASGTHTGIWKIEDLALVGSETTTDDSVWELGDDYVLMADLDFTSAASYRYTDTDKTIYTAGSGFAPIGNDPNYFTGSFDGNNNTIANLYINRSLTDNIGLFGFADGATLKNIGLTGVNVSGTDEVGGLVGYANGSTITNSYTAGTVSGSENVGGLVGEAYGGTTTTNSYATGSVSGSYYVGGLVGEAHGGAITNSYATGDVSGSGDIGGLVGYTDTGSITNSYATGSVTGTDYVGGLVGFAFSGSITNSYATGSVTGDVSGSDDIGGLVGCVNFSVTITNCIAFNPSVSGNTNVNRVLGDGSTTTLTGNYANGSMTVTVGATTTTPTSSDMAGLDGADMTAVDFGNSTSAPYSVSWDFTVDSSTGGSTADNDGYYWQMGTDRPVLYFFDGTSSAQIGNDDGEIPDVTAPTISTYFPADDAADVAQTMTAFTATFSEDVVKGTGDIEIKKSADNSTVFTIAVADVAISGSAVTISLPSGSNLEYSTGYYIEIPATAFKDSSNNAFAGIIGSTTWNFTTTGALLPERGTQVKLVGGSWVVDATGTHTGIWKIEDLALVGSETTTDTGVWELSDSYVLMTNLDFTADASYRNAAGLDTKDEDGDNNKTETLKNALISTDGDSGFAPIGDGSNNFTGSFDGNGNTIANLYIDRDGSDYIGLFRYTSGATLKNIGLTDVNVTGSSYVGGLVAYAISGSTITNSYAAGSVTGSGGFVGGLAGIVSLSSTITNSYARGDVTGSDSYVGGLAGRVISSGSITNSYATGNVTGSSTSAYVGGLVGEVKFNSSITDSYATGTVTGNYNVGGLAGNADGSRITNCIAFTFSISGSGNAHRSLGNSVSATLTGNYANGAMTVNGTPVTGGTSNDLNGADMTAEQFKLPSSYDNDGTLPSLNWDFTADTITGGSTADDDGYYWQMGPNRPVLYFFDGTSSAQIGNDSGAMA